MLVTLSGIVTDVRPLQPENAEAPISITLSGITTDVRPLHLNALSPMLVTFKPLMDSGIATAPKTF